MKIIIKKVLQKGVKKFGLFFPFDFEIKEKLKSEFSATWSAGLKCWLVPYNEGFPAELKLYFSGRCEVELSSETVGFKPNYYDLPEITDAEVILKIQRFQTWLQNRRYSESTIKVYLDSIRTFLRFHSAKKLEEITNEDVLHFNIEYILKRELSVTYQSQFVNALKLFYSVNKETFLVLDDIPRPKKEKKLPNVLSKDEVKSIFEVTTNMKHRAMLSLVYACGLRCSELTHLKPEHLESARGVLRIVQAKGKKDRIVPLSSKLLETLRSYYLAFKPKVWLFEGETAGKPYSNRSLQEVIKNSVRKSGIKKPVTLHWLRHSYATHILESGTDIRYIQTLLGHNSSKTTEIYTHVSSAAITRIKSPFDDL